MASPLYDNSTITAFVTATTHSTSAFAVGGTNRILFANIGTVGSGDVVSTVKWNTTESFTRLQTDFLAGIGVREYMYYIVNPTAGTFAIDVAFAGSQNSIITGISYKDAKQSAPTIFASQQAGAAATWSQSLTTVDDNSLLMVYVDDSIGRTPTPGTNTTLRQDGAGQGSHTLDSTVAITPAGTGTLAISSWSGASSLSTDSLMVVIPPVFVAPTLNSGFFNFMPN